MYDQQPQIRSSATSTPNLTIHSYASAFQFFSIISFLHIEAEISG